MVKSSRRIEQVNEFLRNEVAQSHPGGAGRIAPRSRQRDRGADEPRLAPCAVFISTLGGEKERDAAVATLRRHARHLRHLLAPRITFRSVPSLDFRPDSSLEAGAAVLRALTEVERERAINPPRLDDEPPPEPTEKAGNPRARKRRTED